MVASIKIEGIKLSELTTKLDNSTDMNQELEEGLISIAAPLTNRTGQTVAALNISGQANRTSAAVMQERLLPTLLSAARTISRMMGAPRG